MDVFGDWADQYLDAARADGFAWLLDETGFPRECFDTEDVAKEFGAGRAARFVETVATVLVYRKMDRPDEEPAWRERFLSLQRYGKIGWEVGARYSLRFVGPFLTCSLHIDSMNDLDLEDLWDSFGYDLLEVMPNRTSDMTDEHTAAIFEAVVADLTYDSALKLERQDPGPYRVDVTIHERGGA